MRGQQGAEAAGWLKSLGGTLLTAVSAMRAKQEAAEGIEPWAGQLRRCGARPALQAGSASRPAKAR